MNKRLAGMTAVAALLGGYVAVEGLGLFQSPDSVNAPAAESAAARSEALKLNPLDGLDPESFTAIVDKPLFNPSRQARPAEPVAPPPVEQHGVHARPAVGAEPTGRPREGEEVAVHEPGAQTVLGRRYAQDGVDQGEAVLRDLAASPQTARHLATKLLHADFAITQFFFDNLTTAIEFVRAGKLRALGLTSAQRNPMVPDQARDASDTIRSVVDTVRIQ